MTDVLRNVEPVWGAVAEDVVLFVCPSLKMAENFKAEYDRMTCNECSIVEFHAVAVYSGVLAVRSKDDG